MRFPTATTLRRPAAGPESIHCNAEVSMCTDKDKFLWLISIKVNIGPIFTCHLSSVHSDTEMAFFRQIGRKLSLSHGADPSLSSLCCFQPDTQTFRDLYVKWM